MPAINVARTDTFERQRQKINQIGDQIFNITQGGSDLATGNLKLGDGTQNLPSLAFDSDNSVGLFKPDIKTLGFVSGTKKIYEYNAAGVSVFSYLDFKKKSLFTSGLNITNPGANYDPGAYTNVNATGGSGTAASFDIVVTGHNGTINSYSKDYNPGTYQNVNLTGGNGTGATINFGVSSLTGTITDNGNTYAQGIYNGVSLTGGNGSNATADIAVGAVGNIFSVNIVNSGSGYQVGDVLSANDADLGGGGGSGFQFTIETVPGVIENLQWTDKGSNYQVGDVLLLPSQITGQAATLKGSLTGVSVILSTASPTVSVASTAGIFPGMFITAEAGSTGSMFPGTEVQSVDSVNNTITFDQNPTGDGAASLTITSQGTLEETTIATGLAINIGDIVTTSAGPGQLAANTTVSSYDSGTGVLTLNQAPSLAGPATLTITPAFGYTSNTPWAYTITEVGVVESISVNNPGFGYIENDQLSVSSFDLVQPITFSVTVNAVTEIQFQGTISSGDILATDSFEFNPGALPQPLVVPIIKIVESGGNITSVFVGSSTFTNGDVLTLQRTSVDYTVDSTTNSNKFFIDGSFTPDLTLYSGNTYVFDYSTVTGHPFALSAFPDGPNSPSIVNQSTTLSTSSKTITVSSTTGISSGMTVASGGSDAGQVASNTFVDTVVDATTLTLTEFPTSNGSSALTFAGVPYTDGVVSGSTTKTIKVSDTTPNLYYYCEVHPDMGGDDGNEGILTIDTNNPKVFGSGLLVNANQIQEVESIKFDIVEGRNTLTDVIATTATVGDLTVSNGTSTDTLTATTSVSTPLVSAQNQLLLSGASVKSTANFLVGNFLTIASSDGDISTTGTVSSGNGFVSNNQLVIENNSVKTLSGYNLVLQPYSTNCVEIDSSTSLNIPVGTTLERPGLGVAANGSIRFNTDSGQYEGYNATTTSWSSLGGVRDIDGNTYILAELTAGANDNTLWFYNDSVNTARLTTSQLRFESVKELASPRSGIPAYSEWTSNTPVSVGDYIKYRNNLYEVTGAGTTGTAGTEPTHTSGAQNNGTAQFTWSQIAVSPIIFNEVEEVRIGPNKDCPLIVSAEIKILDNQISSLVEDLIFKPNAGKQTIVDSNTHFRIPAGDNNAKNLAPAGPGSIRFNTEIQQFEGYSGTNWSSLGGVRDVDGNTYIIPETAPAANENILFFYNNNVNTLKLSESALDFTNIDTITTGGNNLEISAEIITLNAGDTTIDNTSNDSTFISSTKQYLDLGLSSGLNVDPILRLDDQGDVFLNTTFGSGTFNGVKVLDGALKEFELADYKIKTSTFNLIKGGSETSAVVLYPSATSKGCKVTVVSKSASGKRSMSEYSVIDNGTDIFHNEYASLNTSANQYTAVFDFNASTEARLTLTLSDDHTTGDIVAFTVLVQEIK